MFPQHLKLLEKYCFYYNFLIERTFTWFSSCRSSYWESVGSWGGPSPPPCSGQTPTHTLSNLTMDKQGDMSTPGKVSGLKPPSKIARPAGVSTKTSPSSGKNQEITENFIKYGGQYEWRRQ